MNIVHKLRNPRVISLDVLGGHVKIGRLREESLNILNAIVIGVLKNCLFKIHALANVLHDVLHKISMANIAAVIVVFKHIMLHIIFLIRIFAGSIRYSLPNNKCHNVLLLVGHGLINITNGLTVIIVCHVSVLTLIRMFNRIGMFNRIIGVGMLNL